MSIVEIKKSEPAENPDHILEKAKGEYESVFVIGYDKNGVMDVRSSLNLQIKDVLFLLEMFKHKLLDGDYWE